MLREIHLHGALRDQFGPSFRMNVDSAAAAGRALGCLVPGFRKAVIGNSYRVIRRAPKGDTHLGMDELTLGLGKAELHIVPVIAGEKGSGAAIGKIVLGIALVAAAFVFAPAAAGLGATAFSVFGASVSYGSIALFGAAMAFAGLSQVLSPSPKAGNYGDRNKPDQRPSFLFNGAVNTAEQGGPVPLVFGRFRTGSQVISAGLVAEQI